MTPEQTAFIRATRAAIKSDSAREVAAYLGERTTRTMQTSRVVTKDAETLAFERAGLAEIESFLEAVTGSKDNALARLAAINSAQMLAAVRGGKKAKPEKGQEINDRSDALILLYLDAQRRGYEWPLPSHFGAESYSITEPVVVPGKTRWAEAFPDAPLPSLDEISREMN